MAHVKWCGCLLKAVCLFAMIDSLQANEQPRRIETRQVNQLEGPEDSLNFVGTNATFNCVSPLRSCLNMTWYKEEWIWYIRDFSQINDLDAYVTARILVENTTSGCKLTLMNVELDDDGRIYCQLYAGSSSIQGRKAQLTTTTQRYALRGMSDNASFVGENVDFICISPLRNCVGISWHKYLRPRDYVIIFSAQEGNFLRNKYLLGNTTLGCRLTIRNLDLTDNGGYICKIEISQRPVEITANLYVFVPLNRPENLMSFVGTNTTFSCVSTLRSCVNMTWFEKVTTFFGTYFPQLRTFNSGIGGKYIVENTTVGCQLTIRNVQRDDTGSYKCELRFGDRLLEGSIVNLKVTSQENALRGPSDGMYVVGQWITFTCLSPFGDCRGMSWYKDTPWRDRDAIYSEENGIYLRDKYIVENSTTEGCRLTIKNVQVRDTGSVYCQIQISRTAVEKSATFIISARQVENPLTLTYDTLSFINATALLTCLSPLWSCAKINWYKLTPATHTRTLLTAINEPQSTLRDRYVLDTGTRVCKLIIRNVRLNDAGYYACEIVLGSTSFQGKAAFLTVIDTPEPSAQENALQKMSNNFGAPGSDVSFTCVSPLRDCTGINWYTSQTGRYHFPVYKDGNVVDNRFKYIVRASASGCELIIRNVHKIDIANVVCDIVISQRTFPVLARLYVVETNSRKISLSFVGANATFTCDSPLENCDNMTWYIDDLPSIFGPPEFVPINDVDSTVRNRWAVQKTSSGCKLTLINVQLTDAGHVYCNIILGGRPFRGGITNLTVFNEGEALSGLADRSVATRQDATFTCVSPLRNCIEMFWYKQEIDTGGPVYVIPQTGLLNTDRVEIFDPHTRADIYTRSKYIVENSTQGCQLTVKNVNRFDVTSIICEIKISQRTYEKRAILRLQ